MDKIEDPELKGFIDFLAKYPDSTWWDYYAYVQYSRQKWSEFVHGLFGI
jgi:hypothetical protein